MVTHELGHALGLYHDTSIYAGFNADDRSVMYPSVALGITRRNFSDYDYAWLQHLYAGATDPGSNGTPEQVDAQAAGDQLLVSDVAPSTPAIIAAPSRMAPATVKGAATSARPAGLTAILNGDASSTSSSLAGSQGQPPLLTVLSQGTSGATFAPTSTVALPSARTGMLVTPLSGLPAASMLRLPSSGGVESSGGDSPVQAIEDELPTGEPPATAADTGSASAVAEPAEEPASDGLPRAVPWREACTVFFTQHDLTSFSEDRDMLPHWSTAEEAAPASNPGAAAAVLAVALGSYWSTQPEITQRRRRPSE